MKGILKMQLNSIKKVEDDPTLVKATFSILDFEQSGNKQIFTKELAKESAPTLKLKPLLCQYFQTTDYENQNDHFGTHGEFATKDRYGNDTIQTNTFAIGVSQDGGYFGTIQNENGEDVEVLLCDFYLWALRYSDVVNLMFEMHEAGQTLYSSCEYWYSNYEVNDGVQTLKSPVIFDGHCLLQSGENGTDAVAPAYKTSQLISFNERWNKAVAQVLQNQQNQSNTDVDNIQNNNIKEVNVVADMFKKVCELSFDDIRTLLYKQLETALSENEYDNSWITQVYETYFIVSYWGDNHKYFKVNYTKENETISIDWENRTEVYLYQEWRELPQSQEVEKQVNELTVKLTEVTEEKETLATQFNEASEKLTSLNAMVEEFKPYKEKYEEEQYQKAVNEKKAFYQTKFKAVNAVEKFESEEIQNLIMVAAKDNDESKDAVLQLNTILIDLVEPVVEETTTEPIREMSSKRQNLVPTKTDFDSRYGA